jgi:hypothetical protein
MTDFRNWYVSKGVWGEIVALLAGRRRASEAA